jgi:hypothetical protein
MSDKKVYTFKFEEDADSVHIPDSPTKGINIDEDGINSWLEQLKQEIAPDNYNTSTLKKVLNQIFRVPSENLRPQKHLKIAVGSLKGGVGKSTIVAGFAVAHLMSKKLSSDLGNVSARLTCIDLNVINPDLFIRLGLFQKPHVETTDSFFMRYELAQGNLVLMRPWQKTLEKFPREQATIATLFESKDSSYVTDLPASTVFGNDLAPTIVRQILSMCDVCLVPSFVERASLQDAAEYTQQIQNLLKQPPQIIWCILSRGQRDLYSRKALEVLGTTNGAQIFYLPYCEDIPKYDALQWASQKCPKSFLKALIRLRYESA